ncbi:MAG TPA: hypothetical protein VM867_06375 [Xanthobacteraceae bacterium]|nr:hypothetical protein [Xanthobacteraceae bacterium]
MEKYYSVISRAVADLDGGEAAARRAIYEQAQAALMGELARMSPPPDAGHIDSEYRALNAAIRRVEAEVSGAHRERRAQSEQNLLNAIARVQAEIEDAKPSPFRVAPIPGREVRELVGLLPD